MRATSRGKVLSHSVLLQKVEDKLHDHVIFNTQQICHTLRDPRLDGVQVHLVHVHLTHNQQTVNVYVQLHLIIPAPARGATIFCYLCSYVGWVLESFEELLLIVVETSILLHASTL